MIVNIVIFALYNSYSEYYEFSLLIEIYIIIKTYSGNLIRTPKDI